MRTKRRARTEAAGDGLARRALYAKDAYWIAVAAKLTGVSMHEYVSRELRANTRRLLAANGIDPDKAWAQYAAGRNGE